MSPDGLPAVDQTSGSEPASVTASRQLAADSRDRRRRVPRGPAAGERIARRSRGTKAGSPAIRPLGRPGVEHLDGTASAAHLAAGWRLGRAGPTGAVARDESLDEEVGPCSSKGDDVEPPGA